MSASTRSVALALYNMGGPETQDEVEAFLSTLFQDSDLLGIPFGDGLQRFVANRIVRGRLAAVKQKYQEIGGGSPQRRITESLCAELAGALARTPVPGLRFDLVTPLFRYTKPRAAEVFAAAAAKRIDEIWLVPQYPHCSRATTGSSLREAGLLRQRLHAENRAALTLHTLEPFYDHPAFLDLWTERLKTAWEALPAGRRFLVISAHNLPLSYVLQGDPYRAQVYRTAREVTRRLRLAEHVDWALSWQSAVGRVRWMTPDTQDVLRQLGAQPQAPAVLVWPVSFVSDHIETLHEIDIEFAQLARACGLTHFTRVPNLNAAPDFASFLADRIREAAEDRAGGAANKALRSLESNPSGPSCHTQPGGCLCGRYFASGAQGLTRSLLPPLA